MMESTNLLDRSDAGRPRSQRGVEFYLYFTLLFVIALPFGVERYLASIIRRRSLNTHGPIARAWAEADRITPLIFSR